MTLFLILITLIILTSVWLSNVSLRIGIPTLFAFIVLGMVFGNNGLLPIHFENHLFAKDTCTLALIFIMFYGGFGTRWKAVRPIICEAGLMASAGVVLTAGLTGLFCHFILHWEWPESFLLGAVVSSTDAASVFSILRSRKLGLKNNTAPLLEVESGSNDPFSYMLTVVMLSVMQGRSGAGSIAWMLFTQIAFGIGCGIGIAKLAELVLKRIHIQTSGFDSLFMLAVAMASYAIPDLIGGNGYLSAYLVGIYLGNVEFGGKKTLVSFFDGITGLMQVIIFFLLGLLAHPALLHKAVLPAAAVFLFMLIAARPLATATVLTPFRKYGFRQQTLVSFAGLRGAASIVFAIMATTDNQFLQHDLFNIVFCLVLLSISLQGSLLPLVARKLGMIDLGNDVMKTFNDYSEGTEMQFGRIEITADSVWNRQQIMELNLPKNMLIALVLRGNERIVPNGQTRLYEGDQVVTVTKTFEDSHTYLEEQTIKENSKWKGSRLGDCPQFSDKLVIMIQRASGNVIPNGDTILEAGDILVIVGTD